jgi:membrane fusion protein (multidrug efflux system)
MKKLKQKAPSVARVKYVTKRNPIAVGIGLLLALTIIFYFGSKLLKSNKQEQHHGGFAMSVEAHKVTVQVLDDKIVTVGSVKANESVIIRSEIPGIVREIQFQEGTSVKKGDILVILKDDVHKAELDQAEANLKLSQSNHERTEKLLKDKFKSMAQADVALSEFKRDQALVERSRAMYDKTKLRAPFDGIIGLRLVSPGDYITVGEDIVNLESIDPVKIDFRVPEIFVSKVKPGQEVLIKTDAHANREYRGKIYAINPQVDVNGRSLAMRAEVQNQDRTLLPGMFVIVTVMLQQFKNAIVVPEEALVPKGKEQFVYRVIDKKAKLTKVTVGLRLNGKAHIVQGLTPQDVVVTAGQLKIQDGAAVNVIEAKG